MPVTAIDQHLTPDDLAKALRRDVLAGLAAPPRTLPPKWFYDARGSALFEQITRLPEYYPTRSERAILAARAGEIARATGAETLLELGAGSADKTRLLLDALRGPAPAGRGGTLRTYVPVDVSGDFLAATAKRLAADYPGLAVHAVVADYERHLALLPDDGRRLVAFLGGTVGNLTPDGRGAFLSELRACLNGGDALLLGADLVKAPARLVRAYDDAAGVTAEFNRNVLHVLNRELDADFAPGEYAHVAVWDTANEWIEMRLRARRAQRVGVAALGLEVTLEEGEEIRTEISAKFRRDGLAGELAAVGFMIERWWTDPAGDYALCLARPT